SIATRMSKHPDVFREDKGVMFCNYCDLSVEWKAKSTVDGHCSSKGHLKNKQMYENKEKSKKQVTLATTITSESKKELISIFKKHLKEGGAIPQASTL
ncbi:19653_t:CDS:2, partial [Racocetra fulgida]